MKASNAAKLLVCSARPKTAPGAPAPTPREAAAPSVAVKAEAGSMEPSGRSAVGVDSAPVLPRVVPGPHAPAGGAGGSVAECRPVDAGLEALAQRDVDDFRLEHDLPLDDQL